MLNRALSECSVGAVLDTVAAGLRVQCRGRLVTSGLS
jgi:hypothetical protein